MKSSIKIILIIAIFFNISVYAQSSKEKALEKGKEAVKLEDEGKFDEAIKLLEEAQKLDPDNLNYPYELAYSYYAKKEYKQAVKYLEPLLKKQDNNDRVYQLLGNTYDNLGKPEKAIETYEDGIKKFPKSGNLYLECGIMEMGKKEYNNALSYYEKGIQADPEFPSNYFWASKIFCSSTEEVWGMIYGELFMNLERNTKRTAEISKLLFDTYKSEIQFTSDTSFTVSFSKFASVDVNDMKLPFGVGVYEPTLMFSIINEKTIDINSLDRIRKNFVENYYKNKNEEKYPNILFDYQKQVGAAGHLEAYNHWILMMGDEEGFDKWQKANTEKWEKFVKWFGENGITVDETHKFFRAQY